MSHRNARLTVFGRRLLVQRVCSGRPVAHVAAEMGISRATASRPHTTPHRTPSAMEDQVCELRRTRNAPRSRTAFVHAFP